MPEQLSSVKDHPKTLRRARESQVPMRELQVPIQATTSLPTELTDVASEDRCADDRRIDKGCVIAAEPFDYGTYFICGC